MTQSRMTNSLPDTNEESPIAPHEYWEQLMEFWKETLKDSDTEDINDRDLVGNTPHHDSTIWPHYEAAGPSKRSFDDFVGDLDQDNATHDEYKRVRTHHNHNNSLTMPPEFLDFDTIDWDEELYSKLSPSCGTEAPIVDPAASLVQQIPDQTLYNSHPVANPSHGRGHIFDDRHSNDQVKEHHDLAKEVQVDPHDMRADGSSDVHPSHSYPMPPDDTDWDRELNISRHPEFGRQASAPPEAAPQTPQGSDQSRNELPSTESSSLDILPDRICLGTGDDDFGSLTTHAMLENGTFYSPNDQNNYILPCSVPTCDKRETVPATGFRLRTKRYFAHNWECAQTLKKKLSGLAGTSKSILVPCSYGKHVATLVRTRSRGDGTCVCIQHQKRMPTIWKTASSGGVTRTVFEDIGTETKLHCSNFKCRETRSVPKLKPVLKDSISWFAHSVSCAKTLSKVLGVGMADISMFCEGLDDENPKHVLPRRYVVDDGLSICRHHARMRLIRDSMKGHGPRGAVNGRLSEMSESGSYTVNIGGEDFYYRTQ